MELLFSKITTRKNVHRKSLKSYAMPQFQFSLKQCLFYWGNCNRESEVSWNFAVNATQNFVRLAKHFLFALIWYGSIRTENEKRGVHNPRCKLHYENSQTDKVKSW